MKAGARIGSYAPVHTTTETPPVVAPTSTTQTERAASAPAPSLVLPSAAAPQHAQWSAWVSALSPRAPLTFLDAEAIAARMEALRARGVDVREIGRSQEGRPIHAGVVGHGPIVISVMAAAHPDEPTGALTALHLLEAVGTDPRFAALQERVTLHIVPCANPDGVARNAAWFSSWQRAAGAPPDLLAYFRHVARDLPADDVEFGFPDERGDARPENRALASWLDGIGRVDHHASLHSMFLGGGALFLVTAADLQAQAPALRFLLGEADAVALPLHDKDRAGQKGFFRLGAGLQTAPTAEAMRAFFAGTKTAESFKLNSMQYAQKHADAPLALVSEIPLVYDARISSMKPAGRSRAHEEERFADGLLAMVARVRTLVTTLAAAPHADARDPDALGRALQDLDKRLTSAETAARAQKADLARYGDMPATEGNVVENDLNLLRREATLLATLARQLETHGLGESPHADAVEERLRELVDAIGARFRLRFPPVEVQVRLQIAAVLAGALDAAPPPIPGPPPGGKSPPNSGPKR